MYPYSTHCNFILGAASETYLKKVLILQKRAVSVIDNAAFHDHSSLLFKHAKIINIEEIYRMNCCIIALLHSKTKSKYLRANITHDTRNNSD